MQFPCTSAASKSLVRGVSEGVVMQGKCRKAQTWCDMQHMQNQREVTSKAITCGSEQTQSKSILLHMHIKNL